MNETIGQVFEQLRTAVEAVAPGLEYFSSCVEWSARTPEHARSALIRDKPALWLITKDSPFPQPRWIACYPVTGGSEGHYVHVDCVVFHGNERVLIPLFLGKTFGGMDEAVTIAATCAKLLGA